MAKKREYTVTHPSLYLRVNDKIQEVEVGTTLELTPERAKRMLEKKMITPAKGKKVIKLKDDK